jgi:predicted nucleotidyltransferase
MIANVKDNLEKIIEACQQMQLQSLYLFGSAAREKDFTAESDLDFLYQFRKNKDGYPVAGYDYFDLMFLLEDITGKKIDLVAEEKLTNSYMIKSINEDKIKIYES